MSRLEKVREYVNDVFRCVQIDADVLHHCLYDPGAPVIEREQERFKAPKKCSDFRRVKL